MRSKISFRIVTMLALGVTVSTLALAGPRGQGGEQILRPAQEDGSGILTADRVARLSIALPVAPEVAWDAWTSAPQLVEWFAHWAEMTVAPDGDYRVGWDGFDGVWQGRYLEVDRPDSLSFSWLPPADVFPAGAYETIVTLTFEEDDEGGTRMTLEHSGFRGSAELEAQLQAWRGYLFALRAFLLQPRADR